MNKISIFSQNQTISRENEDKWIPLTFKLSLDSAFFVIWNVRNGYNVFTQMEYAQMIFSLIILEDLRRVKMQSERNTQKGLNCLYSDTVKVEMSFKPGWSLEVTGWSPTSSFTQKESFQRFKI